MNLLINEKQFLVVIDSIKESRVNDVIRKIDYLKKLNREVGFLGPITNKQLFKGSMFKEEAQNILESLDYDEEPDKDNILYKLWDRYYKAMSRRLPDSGLGLYNFVNYIVFSDYPVYIFKHNKSYIIGQFDRGYFKPSHFAPNSLRDGVDAIKELIKFNNIIFAVTDVLADMLIKMGSYYNGMVFPMYFRDKFVDKHIVATDEKTLNKIADELLELNNDFGDLKYKDRPEAEVFLKQIGYKE